MIENEQPGILAGLFSGMYNQFDRFYIPFGALITNPGLWGKYETS
jgi:hypothetical protein